MKETTNLGLKEYGVEEADLKTTFRDFRLAISGVQDSNTEIIDSVIGNPLNLNTESKELVGAINEKTKVSLDGTGKTNFDFISDKVVQDGLIENKNYTSFEATTFNPNDKNFTIIVKFTMSSSDGSILGNCPNSSLLSGFRMYTHASKDLYFGNSGASSINKLNTQGLNVGVEYTVVISKFDTEKYILQLLQGSSLLTNSIITKNYQSSPSTPLSIKGYGAGAGVAIGSDVYAIIYNRTLTHNEIQQNLQALNNLPSISQIATTNTDGSKSTYKLASDSEHVVMRNGYNAEECLTGIYDMCKKEFLSTDGSPITIHNAIDKSKILNAEIKGQTIKNYVPTNGTKKQVGFTTNSKAIYLNISKVVPSKKYWISGNITNSINETTIIAVSLDGGNTRIGSVTAKNGRFNLEFTMPTSYEIKNIWFYHTLSDIDILCDINYISLTDNKITSYIPFGLSSTQAIIENNGLKYTFYLKDGTPIILRGVGNVRDTFDIKDDGSGVYEKKLKYYSTENHIALKEGAKGTNVDIFLVTCTTDSSRISSTARISTNSFINPSGTAWDTTESLYGIYLSSGSSTHTDIGIAFPKGSTIDDVRSYLNANIIEAISSLEVPIAITIPKELTPTIGLNKTNICKVDSAVSPSEFKVVAPVDCVAELTARLEALEAKTNTQSVNTAFVEETYAKSVNKIEEVIK